MHRAAKFQLTQMLRDGRTSFSLLVGCPGHLSFSNFRVKRPDEHLTEKELRVPPLDNAQDEVPFGPYTLDAAATQNDKVVFGLEVYQTSQVNETKEAFLMKSGIPWFEVEASSVLQKEMPWLAIRSSYGETMCTEGKTREEETKQARKQILAEERRAEELRQKTELQRIFDNRITYVAL